MKNKKLNPAAIIALKEALASIYWYKNDLRSFLVNTLDNTSILGAINWDDYKRSIADRLVETLVRNEEYYQNDLLHLFAAVASMDDFSHLEYLDGGKQKAERARKAVGALRKYTSRYQVLQIEKEKSEEKRTTYVQEQNKKNIFRQKRDDLKQEFIQLTISSNPQERGFQLESLIKELFDLFDLDPKASFKIEGEQIDGAFTFEGNDFLFEAKWQNDLVRASALDSLAAKVQRKLDNTLGLFLSINGFSPEGVSAHSFGRRVLLLMDGSDVMAVLEDRIDLHELFRRKRRHAAQTGNILFRYQDMVG